MNFNRIRRKISLDGKVAIVTGASRPNGQGRATARALAARGASILVTDIPEQVPEMTEGVGGGGMGSSSLLLETVEELKTMGAQAACFPANLAKKEDIRFTVNGETFTMEEMRTVIDSDYRWEFGEFATVSVLKEGGLEKGKHHIYAKQIIAPSYMPFQIEADCETDFVIE